MNTKSRAHHWVASFASCLPVLHEPIASGWHRHVAPTWCHRSVRPLHDLLHAGNVLRRWALGIRRNAETRKVRAAPRNRATEFTQVFSWDLFFVSWCPKPINYKGKQGKQRHCSDFQLFAMKKNTNRPEALRSLSISQRKMVQHVVAES